jgi:hypothetical protein
MQTVINKNSMMYIFFTQFNLMFVKFRCKFTKKDFKTKILTKLFQKKFTICYFCSEKQYFL